MSGDRSDEVTGDMSGDGRWMTYAELAEHRGISRPSAERLVLRKRWRRQRGNDRTVRILVPRDTLSGDVSDDMSGDRSDDASADMSGDAPDNQALFAGALAALESALAEANKRADAALALADRLGTQVADAGERTERLAHDLAVAITAADQARSEAQVAHEQAQALRATVDELRADQAHIEDAHAAELAAAQDAARRAEEAAEALRQAEEVRKARGRLRRAWDGWRGR